MEGAFVEINNFCAFHLFTNGPHSCIFIVTVCCLSKMEYVLPESVRRAAPTYGMRLTFAYR